ncbi:MAG: helix-turn-helix domain-containing protein [Terriglobia bacterium]|nr:helix-turn-helix domain-containing protein [Terriglobia bacterium]
MGPKLIAMISPRQIRAARALLDWSQQDLADKGILSLNAVTRLERDQVDPRVSTITAVQRALVRGGVEFISEEASRGEGVRLIKPASAPRKRKPAKSRRD